MFCSSLRRRRSFASIIPILTASVGLGLQESSLEGHHISIPLAYDRTEVQAVISTPAASELRILLISPTDMAETKINGLTQILRRFAQTAKGTCLAILFLLAPCAPSTQEIINPACMDTGFTTAAKLLANSRAVQPQDEYGSYVELQHILATTAEIAYIPLLPLYAISALPALLQSHVKHLQVAISRVSQENEATGLTTFDLLQLCSKNPPMRRSTAYYITDLFPDLSTFADKCSRVCVGDGNLQGKSSVGLRDNDARLEQLRILIDEREFGDVVGFWGVL